MDLKITFKQLEIFETLNDILNKILKKDFTQNKMLRGDFDKF